MRIKLSPVAWGVLLIVTVIGTLSILAITINATIIPQVQNVFTSIP